MASVKSSSILKGTASRERLYRNALIFMATLFVMLIVRDVNRHQIVALRTAHPPNESSDSTPRLSSRARMLEITANNTDFRYFPRANLLLMTMAKGGTTSTFNWLYHGMRGREYHHVDCETYVQDISSECWGDDVINLYKLDEQEQWRILTSRETLRVAIQRNPFERLVSSWKSKITCESEVYGTDVRNRGEIVPRLLRRAGLPDDKECLSLAEYAEALEAARNRVKDPAGKLGSLRQLDVHVRPQEFYFDEVDYDLILDVKDLGNRTYVKPILQRLPHKHLEEVENGPPSMHASTGDQIMIPERTAKLLHLFAMESKWGETKYMV